MDKRNKRLYHFSLRRVAAFGASYFKMFMQDSSDNNRDSSYTRASPGVVS